MYMCDCCVCDRNGTTAKKKRKETFPSILEESIVSFFPVYLNCEAKKFRCFVCNQLVSKTYAILPISDPTNRTNEHQAVM